MYSIFSKIQSLPYLLLVFATFFWGTNFVFSRMIVDEIPPFQFSVMRWMIAGLVFLPFVWKELKGHKEVMKKNWKPLVFMGVTGIAGFNTMLYIALQFTTSINASLVNSTTPLLIVLLSVLFLKEKLVRSQYFGVAISFIGVLVVLTGGSLRSLWELSLNLGNFIILVAVLFWSTYSILMKRFGVELPKKSTFIITICIGIIVLIPFALFERTYAPVSFYAIPWEVLAGVVYLGIFPSIISFICWNEGVMQVGPGKASNYLHLIVLFTTILAVIFGGEVLGWTQVFGGVLLLSGVIIASNPQFLHKKVRLDKNATM